MFNTFTEVLEKLADNESFTREEAESALNFIVRGEVNEARSAAFLFGMRQKGETVDELTGFTNAMRAAAIPLPVNTSGAVDVCGTGGDHSGTFNISTAAMFVTAGCGVPVLKHGNRSISSRSGSYDVLEALGCYPALPPDKAAVCFEKCGITFMFAPLFHPAMKHVMPGRKSLGMRTFFNILGPILNPAGVKRQVVGAYDEKTAEICARILMNTGTEKFITVHASDGMDEFSTTSDSVMFTSGPDQEIACMPFNPELFGIKKAKPESLKGGDAAANAKIIRSVLEGASTREQQDVVVLNAAAALVVAGRSQSMADGISRARESVLSGSALRSLDKYAETSSSLSA
ncbi:MAG: anthranilate phosphoribosyltransferase [Balneolales bacterium]|nr:anthranilate phosphoribosyltransferase [Balneolales bacterium]